VLKWPDKSEVVNALRAWATRVRRSCPSILHVGYIGSYAREDWGVGSDLDVIVVVKESSDKAGVLSSDMKAIPVPVDLRVFSLAEWEGILRGATRFSRVLREEGSFV